MLNLVEEEIPLVRHIGDPPRAHRVELTLPCGTKIELELYIIGFQVITDRNRVKVRGLIKRHTEVSVCLIHQIIVRYIRFESLLGGLQLDMVLDLVQYRTEGARRTDGLVFVSEFVIPEHRLPVIDDTLYIGVRDGLIAEFFEQPPDEPLVERLEQTMLCERIDIHLIYLGVYAKVVHDGIREFAHHVTGLHIVAPSVEVASNACIVALIMRFRGKTIPCEVEQPKFEILDCEVVFTPCRGRVVVNGFRAGPMERRQTHLLNLPDTSIIVVGILREQCTPDVLQAMLPLRQVE